MVPQAVQPLLLNKMHKISSCDSFQSMKYHHFLLYIFLSITLWTLLCSFHPKRKENAFSLAFVQERFTTYADLLEMPLDGTHLILDCDGSQLQTETGNGRADLCHSRSQIILKIRFIIPPRACWPAREKSQSTQTADVPGGPLWCLSALGIVRLSDLCRDPYQGQGRSKHPKATKEIESV